MKKFKEIVFNNLHLKILSLLVAFLLWLNITSTQKTRFEFFAEVKILNKPESLEIVKVEPEKVLVVIEGIRSKLNQVNISKITAYVDGRNLKKGKNTVKVFVKPSKTENFDVVQVIPDKIHIYTKTK
ncbi:YbbR-like protein [Persephonella hydrogeniphila]|uniref:YbbR-like protein n=1 Tax=Persephonella hydrogeniphila TaxID=198703 RepID=A0A285MY60_9AQUI|nr:CdaR family protein [Persephonella hydrogeniphila]SNZ02149.1 YbbR-like protein [Persephonella hydrogeniphila]